ncbi:hypothetical protein [Legionella israelensis]|uniref:Uncharacterized protein n=1 Tax=Legionella israelensis TaxID=454 RepID=A0A0W0VKX6_9GAMM|nr:hypothetical protein [Legionella israelensis]KTD20752.1 hypothetical protein Lisr_1651 [Legionella israelensis]QBS09049.1 hypothetical protein E4T55_03785 [Legionella israelensis]SCY55895.1 hypothetical protein SAMN02746069_02857 [Legionella israelensis DSM 19235]STX58763.1 Uncharacterised protein [Legionella israelensis]
MLGVGKTNPQSYFDFNKVYSGIKAGLIFKALEISPVARVMAVFYTASKIVEITNFIVEETREQNEEKCYRAHVRFGQTHQDDMNRMKHINVGAY